MGLKICAGILLLIILIIIGLVLACAITGKGKIKPFIDKGGIAEKTFLCVNGCREGLIIRGRSADNPVLLFVSGGPGVPQYWLNEAYEKRHPNKIEDEFTVCWWDYRGEGLSFDSSLNPADITLEQLAQDAVAVADYLKRRFNKEKIYLMAHSGGTMLGMYLAQEKPESFYCYFAMGQVADAGWGRHDAGYRFMKSQFEKNGQTRAIRKMESYLTEKNGVMVADSAKSFSEGAWEKLLLKAGCATMREMRSNAVGIFLPEMLCGCYTPEEKINFWKGRILLGKSPYQKESVRIDDVKPAAIPVYFLSGHYDYTTPVPLAKALYERLEAPDKAFYEFENSAHSPLWEENEAVLRVMRKHLTSTDFS